MISRSLLIEVRLLDGRYHGRVDWPPSPFRLFQALVAGAYGGRWAAEPEAQRLRKDVAFKWLEERDAPLIAAPHARQSRGVELYVPNNDLDSVGGDPANVAKVRGSTKLFAPRLFDADVPFLYAWPFAGNDAHALLLCDLVERMHTLGYGIDAAFARADVTSWAETETRLGTHGGSVARPGIAAHSSTLRCPVPGSLESLQERHASAATRFERRREGRSIKTTFRKAPGARSREVAYSQPPTLLLFDLRRADGAFHVLRTERAVELTLAVRDRTLKRLLDAGPDQSAEVERLVKGSRDSTNADKAQRLRFYALPSIGHAHAGMGLRRVVVELPPQCPLRVDDVAWALSGEHLSVDRDTGEVTSDLPTLVHAEDRAMLTRYGISESGARRWRTVTPVALPTMSGHGRGGNARVEHERRQAAAIRQALRHSGISPDGVLIRVQSEPFHAAGARAQAFAFSRFATRSLAHVELIFPRPRMGPMILGDGRFLGLGLFAPEREPISMHSFAVTGATTTNIEPLTRALRRAVMARVRDTLGLRDRERLPLFFSGHDENGGPSRADRHAHLYFAADPSPAPLLFVSAPHILARRAPTNDERQHLFTLDHALTGLNDLRAGTAGRLNLRALSQRIDGDRLVGPCRNWQSATDYQPTRHPKRHDDSVAWLVNDVCAECERCGLPRPIVDVLRVVKGPRAGLAARLILGFAVAVTGPILLGRAAHFGGGLFRPVPNVRL